MSSKQDSLFTSDKEEEALEKEYISYLESRGYAVTKLKKGKKSVTIAEVVEYFYKNLKEVSGDRVAVAARLSDQKDFQAVSKFQEKAKKVGLGKSVANETLIDLISLVFTYYRETEKPCPLTDLSYLVSQNGSWMVQMAIQHQQRQEKKWESSAEAESARRAIYSDLDNQVFKELQERTHARILSTQEDNNNDKEENN